MIFCNMIQKIVYGRVPLLRTLSPIVFVDNMV